MEWWKDSLLLLTLTSQEVQCHFGKSAGNAQDREGSPLPWAMGAEFVGSAWMVQGTLWGCGVEMVAKQQGVEPTVLPSNQGGGVTTVGCLYECEYMCVCMYIDVCEYICVLYEYVWCMCEFICV